ncbi:MAG TPA: hypothetical protein EYG57_08985 [Planctomycetes bacterium]|jgi:hypothetical protein|nr:hypothetical protein [Planctomycetaceae bacterium]HIM29680.1 hypothetical protein [Planctomycetota bacterium]
MKLAVPPKKITRWLRWASFASIAMGLASGIIPALTSVGQTNAAASLTSQTTTDMSAIIEVIESMSPGLTGDMGKATSSVGDSMETVQKGGKFVAMLQFILPLAYGVLGFVVLQGMATIIDGQQQLASQLSQNPQPPPLVDFESSGR